MSFGTRIGLATATRRLLTAPACMAVGALLLVVAPAFGGETQEVPSAQKQWNLLLISLDTLRADHVGAYGYQRDTTPNLDRLAGAGALFENCMAASSWTVPSHMSMFTSLYPSVHGVESTQSALGKDVVTLAQSLQSQGYSTAAFVSGPSLNHAMGFDRGFDSYDDFSVTLSHERNLLGLQDSEDMGVNSVVTDPIITRLGCNWLERNADKQFFLFLHYWDIHNDYIPPAPYDTKFDPDYRGPETGRGVDSGENPKPRSAADLKHLVALYDGEIAHTDEHVGTILARLDELKLAERTLVVIVADHGEGFMEHGLFHHGNGLYEELIHVPLLMRAPGMVPAGLRLTQVVGHVDLMPTLLALLKLKSPAHLQGVDVSGAIFGKQRTSDRILFSELNHGPYKLRAARAGDCKFVGTMGRREGMTTFRVQGNRETPGNAETWPRSIADRMTAAVAAGPERPDARIGAAQPAQLDKATIERLRSLGYMQ